MQFQLQKKADGDGYVAADRITVINGAHSLIKYLMIKSAGKIVYDTDNYNVTFAKNPLEYSNDYSKSMVKNSLWYLDTNNTTANTDTGFEARKLLTQAAADDAFNAGGKDVNVFILLNRYSFLKSLKTKYQLPCSYDSTKNYMMMMN